MPHDITALIAWVKDKHTRSGVQQWNGTNGLDALDAIAAALEATQWQPIATAPDGTAVLLWWPHHALRPVIGTCHYGDHWSSEAAGGCQRVQPTHWMPHLAKPEAQS